MLIVLLSAETNNYINNLIEWSFTLFIEYKFYPYFYLNELTLCLFKVLQFFKFNQIYYINKNILTKLHKILLKNS